MNSKGELTSIDFNLNMQRLEYETRTNAQIAEDDMMEYAMRRSCRELSCPKLQDGKCINGEVLCFAALHFKSLKH